MKKIFFLIFLAINSIISTELFASDFKVAYAGFSFSGNYTDQETGIKYTKQIIDDSKINGDVINPISKSLLNIIKEVNGENFSISFDFADLNKGNAESLVMAVTLDNEYFFSEYEPLSDTYINNIQMFFQIMIYNFNSKRLVMAIPYDVTMPFLTKKEPTNEDIIKEIKKFYTEGLTSADDGSVVTAFTQVKKILDNYSLKDKYKFRIGVRNIEIEEKAIEHMPDNLVSNLNAFKNLLAQNLAGRISTHNEIAFVPYTEGMAIGASMKQQFVNSDEIYEVELPKPEFVIDLALRGYKKKLAKSSAVENLYWWASFININISQPDLNKVYLNENLKNIFKKKIPAQIKDIDDWYKYYISTTQLFDNLGMNIDNPSEEWASKVSKNEDLYNNLNNLKPLIKKLQ